ncbi:MAG: histidine phosphatase family protein [Acidimicrobiales bacterium]
MPTESLSGPGESDAAVQVPGAAPPGRARGRLVVARHGATSWSKGGRHTGSTDVPLEDEGRRQTTEIGHRLGGHDFARVLVSPMSRARETCALAGFGGSAEVCDDLLEWDYGAYEGRTTQEIRAGRPDWSLWRDGVVDGETLAEVSRRADRVVALVRSSAGDVLAFAHGHLLRVVCARWLDLAPSEAARFVLDPGAVGVLGWEYEVAVVIRWNDANEDPLG